MSVAEVFILTFTWVFGILGGIVAALGACGIVGVLLGAATLRLIEATDSFLAARWPWTWRKRGGN